MEHSNTNEEYLFLRLYSIDLNTTKHTLRILKRYRRLDVRFCLLRDIVVSYARPFSTNTGVKIPKHHLTKKFIPEHLRPLHKELINARNQLFAHTDLRYRNPRISNLWKEEGLLPMMFRGYDYNKNINQKVDRIEELVNIVETKLNEKLRELKSDF
jgi:hypothetical protein